MNPPAWRGGDPREIIGKRSTIAICVDGLVFGGDVETKHGWSIQLHTDRYEGGFIGAHDNWPRGWRWVFVPNTTRSK
jgi:hypothetical protein